MGSSRRENLLQHRELCARLFPDEDTCDAWADIMAESRATGRPFTAADAWIAAAARQWGVALNTTDYHDFKHLNTLILIPV